MRKKFLSQIESVLGESIPNEMESSVTKLADIDDKILNNCEKLSVPLAISYLRFLTTPDNWDNLVQFHSYFIQNGGNIPSLNDYFVLTLSSSLNEILINRFSDLYVDHPKFRHIKKVNYSDWLKGYDVGGLAYIYNDLKVLFNPPKYFTSVKFDSNKFIEIDSETQEIYFTRYIAQRIARYLFDLGCLSDLHLRKMELEQIAPFEQWTKHGLLAYIGLIQEERSGLWNKIEAPGYLGPDSYFTSITSTDKLRDRLFSNTITIEYSQIQSYHPTRFQPEPGYLSLPASTLYVWLSTDVIRVLSIERADVLVQTSKGTEVKLLQLPVKITSYASTL
ncbi:MAG: hypothetical protein MUF42_17760, partial [Cytophagaceae bacterium]|nr:hypothetical protein [Cytophagaceae bacterium]